MKLFDLGGEVAVVIGATGVLGGALAEGLAAAGAKVAVLGRNGERGEGRVKKIVDAGGAAAVEGAHIHAAQLPMALQQAVGDEEPRKHEEQRDADPACVQELVQRLGGAQRMYDLMHKLQKRA